MGYQEVLISKAPRLTLITDSQRLPRDHFFEVVEQALKGGVDAVLVREKQMDSGKLLAFASTLRDLTRQYDTKLIIHTQADIAKAIGADGVHVASDALDEIPHIRNWLENDSMSISASCHNEIELGFAYRFGADYAFLSPLFPTTSHPDAPHLGVEKFREFAAEVPMPVVALGGITLQKRHEIDDFGVAVIGAILDADDPERAAESLLT